MRLGYLNPTFWTMESSIETITDVIAILKYNTCIWLYYVCIMCYICSIGIKYEYTSQRNRHYTTVTNMLFWYQTSNCKVLWNLRYYIRSQWKICGLEWVLAIWWHLMLLFVYKCFIYS